MNPAPVSRIDHIAVTAPSLALGAAWLEQVLGVATQPGGEHPLMGTHNVLLRLGDDVYLEVIAADPRAAAPARPRWFGLDALEPAAYRDMVRRHYIEAVQGAAPLAYWVHSILDGVRYRYTKLMLPLSNDGTAIDMLMVGSVRHDRFVPPTDLSRGNG